MPYIGTTPTKVVSRQSANVYRYTATAGQTAFTGADLDNNVLACNPADMIVHMNGLRLESTDYTATSTTVTLTTAATAGDEVTVTSFVTFEVADTYTKIAADSRYVNTTGDTMTGNLTIADGTNAMHVEVRNGTNWTGRFAAPAVGKSAIQYFNGSSWANGVEVDSAGRVTMPYQPAFRALFPASYSVGSNVEMTPSVVVTNTGSHYNSSTGRFTAPISGMYHFSFNVRYAYVGYCNYTFRHNGSVVQYVETVAYSSGSINGGNSHSIYLAAGDYVSLFNGTMGGLASDPYASFSGFLIG